ncbi:MAG TPA: 5-deoxy-glucuronate isomerase [Candidatus Hydrogenedentes bacterium]|nr:5-deoxy-glucuronate isomerase [Candidatus Hydrogenedentota bacterium]
MDLLRKAGPLEPGYTSVVAGDTFQLKYLKMGLLRLDVSARSYEENSGEDEIVLDLLSGTCNVHVEGEDMWKDIGSRRSFFDDPPAMVYIPRKQRWRIEAPDPPVLALVFRASARRDTAPAIVRPDAARTVAIGRDNWQRTAAMAVTDNVDADRLIVGETYNLPGHWSSYPPHKHDNAATPDEAPYEEIYYFAVEPKQGFGIQRVYTAPDDPKPLDEVYVVRDGDAVVIPRGYHPVAAAGGYRVGYVWALAGDDRRFGAWSVDPDHAWLTDA